MVVQLDDPAAVLPTPPEGPVELPHTVIMLRIYAHLWPGEEDRTRTVMDAVLGGLRTGCGQEDQATKEIAGQAA